MIKVFKSIQGSQINVTLQPSWNLGYLMQTNLNFILKSLLLI